MAGSTDQRLDGRRTKDTGPSRWLGGAVVGSGASGPSEAEEWHRYQCPVCGHQDRVTLAGTRTSIDCSHCGTPLVVRVTTPPAERASVRVDLDLP